MPDRGRQLEQRRECRRLDGQLQQCADELEQQRGLPCGLGSISNSKLLIVVPREALSCFKRNLNNNRLSGRAIERQAADLRLKMKRYGNLYASVISRESLWQGYLCAKRSKLGRRACFLFERRLGPELEALYQELLSGEYKPKPYFKFVVYEPKRRDIYAPSFRDCVVQHAIYNHVRPIFERTFIDTSFACRTGKGTHKAADYAQAALRRAPAGSYTLQLDIKKFFYSIDRPTLKLLIERKIKDKQLVRLMMLFADYPEPKGIPIGNLLSQLYALIYMNPVDHFVVRELKPAAGYCRYVDDFLLFGLARDQAISYRSRIVEFVSQSLKLELSRSTIAHTKRGVNFCGYRTWRAARFVRKHSLFKARRAVIAGRLDSVVSHLAHASKTRSLQHLLNYAEKTNYELYCSIPKSYHARHYKDAASSGGKQRALHD